MADAGCRIVQVPAPHSDGTFPMLVLYPTDAPDGTTRVGPYTLNATRDAASTAGPSAVVVISHGSGGSHLTHRGLGVHLARAGFVALLPEHPGNNRNDNSRANTAAILEQRPRDLHAALEWVTSADGLASAVDVHRVGVVGHSLGGYTALALAGGRPSSFAHEAIDAVARPVVVEPDPRVAAVVLLAPATPWFLAEGSLDDVRAPILMITAELDRQTSAEHGELIEARLRPSRQLERRVVESAGHYSFLTPFPPEMTNPALPPSQDPPGFDREAFHATMYAEVTAFLVRTLREHA